MRIKEIAKSIMFNAFKLLPAQNKVVATTFRGRKYGENTGPVLEALHEINPDIELVWLKKPEYEYNNVPSYIKVKSYNRFSRLFQYATSKVWLNTHRMEADIKKKKNQLFIQTYHGIAVKKVELDIPSVRNDPWAMTELAHTCELADIFTSNCRITTEKIYRGAFGFKGKIWEIGFPRSDVLFHLDSKDIKRKITKDLGIDSIDKIVLYAPTFRDEAELTGTIDYSVYDIDFDKLVLAFENRFGGNWKVFLRLHPIFLNNDCSHDMLASPNVYDVSKYPSLQELCVACDAFITDYSSAIFDAAILEKPCFIYANDYDAYEKVRGFYVDVKHGPWPYAENNQQLRDNVRNFVVDDYLVKWRKFAADNHFCETGHAARDIAEMINDYLRDDKTIENIKYFEG